MQHPPWGPPGLLGMQLNDEPVHWYVMPVWHAGVTGGGPVQPPIPPPPPPPLLCGTQLDAFAAGVWPMGHCAGCAVPP